MTAEDFGRSLGYVVLAIFSYMTAYGFMSFVLWDASVADWNWFQRLAVVVLGTALLAELLPKETKREE